MSVKALKQLTREEVAQHNKDGDLWIIIDAKVYDLTRFKDLHPGGASVLLDEEIAGQDATETFYGLHRHEVLERPQYARLVVGIIRGEHNLIHGRLDGALSDVPYAEPSWLSKGFTSPYFKESHKSLQKITREFVDIVVYPDAQAREEDGKWPSRHVIQKMGELNLTAMRLGPGKHLEGRVLAGGVVTPEEYDYLHELVIHQEFARVSARGYSDGLGGGVLIGLPPVILFGRPEVKQRVVPQVLSGERHICLAITEAFAGSDVSGMKTTAKKTGDGKYWLINGTKKWITNGAFSDYFTLGCKTDAGFTVILVERGEGLETKPIKTAYSSAAGTAFVTFDNVRVPVENTLGQEGGGLFLILSNFNHERWMMIVTSTRVQRTIVEECFKWISQRKAFGKPLSSQAVVRNKMAAMVARVESLQNWLENVTHQMNNMSYQEQAQKLAGPIALLKMFCTQTAQDTARDAVQIFGGRGISRTGMGRFIEQYHRTVVFDAILGGTEDVLGDLGVRQALRAMPKNTRL